MSDRAELRGPMSHAAWVGWVTMLILAIGVAGYAGAVLMTPELRPPLVQTLFAERPTATVAHFLGGAIALVAGALQLNARLRARFLQAHRWTGRIYVVAVMTGGVGGLALAVQSMGGFIGRAGFALLAVAWLISTGLAYRQTSRASGAPSLDDPQLCAHARGRHAAHLSARKHDCGTSNGARVPCHRLALLGAEPARRGMVAISDATAGYLHR